MPAVDSIPVGAPIWMDLSTSDIGRAAEFYGGLFGWTVVGGDPAEFGGYSTAMLGDARVAGMMPKMGDAEAEGMPDAWSIYLHTADAPATSAAIAANGGQVILEPMEIGEYGSMALYIDPTGAFIGTWQPNQHDGYQVFGEHGAPAWFELMTLDFPAATAFYRMALGVDVADMTGSEHVGDLAYATFTIGGEEYAGIMDANGLMPEGVPSNWLVYFGVDDAEAAAAKAVELGGSIAAPLADTPWGRFALLADPMGAHFAIIGVGSGDEAN